MSRVVYAGLLSTLLFVPGPTMAQYVSQTNISVIDQMPNLPAHGVDMDWRQKAIDFDDLIFDPKNKIIAFDAKGRPLLPAYYGGSPSDNEAITILPALLGRYLLGIDNAQYGGVFTNYFQNPVSQGGNGGSVYLNKTSRTGDSFWYELMPNYYAYALTAAYNGRYGADPWGKMYASANRWHDAASFLGQNYRHEGFNFRNNTAIDGNHIEPDAPGGIAWLEYQAFLHFPSETHFLSDATSALSVLENNPANPNYEGPVMALAAYTAARINAERQANFDVDKFVNWIFSTAQPKGNNAGVHTGKYGAEEINGLSGGSAASRGFSMNTFAPILGLLPMVRYDLHYATAIGKYLLNVATNARLFYTEFLPATNQDLPGQVPAIPYESLDQTFVISGSPPADKFGNVPRVFYRSTFKPYGRGDAVSNGWAATNRSLYGGALVSLIGGTMTRTNNHEVLQWDLLKLDFQHASTYPTYLYYNPNSDWVWINFHSGSTHVDLYELTTHTFLGRNVSGQSKFQMPPGRGYVVAVLPANSVISVDRHGWTLANGRVIGYQ